MPPRSKVSLRSYNTLRLESRALALISVATEVELVDALAWARAQGLPVVPLGEGSNVVLAGNLEALVLHQASRGIEVLQSSSKSVSLRVAAGQDWHGLVRWTLAQGYFGLENLALIPGTVGAAPIQNIGAYGVELSAVVAAVHGRRIDDSSVVTLAASACDFAYRDSIFKGELQDAMVITAVDLELPLAPVTNTAYPALENYLRGQGINGASPQQVFEAVVDIRRSKLPDPSIEPNAGSFFKNPLLPAAQAQALREQFAGIPCYPQPDGAQKLAAAWMIEYCGFKGYRRGDIGVHPEHALVLVNYGSESGAELLSLAADIASQVYQTFGVVLAIEPRVYGVAA